MNDTQGWGLALLIIGTLLTITVFGAVLGIPLMICGAIMLTANGRTGSDRYYGDRPPYVGEVRGTHVWSLNPDGVGYWRYLPPPAPPQRPGELPGPGREDR